jgi:hypothetical protein
VLRRGLEHEAILAVELLEEERRLRLARDGHVVGRRLEAVEGELAAGGFRERHPLREADHRRPGEKYRARLVAAGVVEDDPITSAVGVHEGEFVAGEGDAGVIEELDRDPAVTEGGIAFAEVGQRGEVVPVGRDFGAVQHRAAARWPFVERDGHEVAARDLLREVPRDGVGVEFGAAARAREVGELARGGGVA